MNTLWHVLSALPVEVYGSAVLSMLDLKSCVQLHSAADKDGVETFSAAMSHYLAKPIAVHVKMSSALKWLYEKKVRGLKFTVTNRCPNVFDTITQFLPLIDSIVIVSNIHEQCVIGKLASCLKIAEKIVSLRIFGAIDVQGLVDMPKQLQISQLQDLFVQFPENRSCNATVSALASGNFPFLKKLTLIGCTDFGLGMELVHLVQCCPQLEELYVTGVGVDDATALALAQICGNLHVLHLDKLYLTNTVLDALVVTNPPLRELNTRWAVRDIDAVRRAVRLLGRLHAFKCLEADLLSFDFINTLAAAVRLMTGLQALNLQGFPLLPEVLQAAVQGSTSLTSIFVEGSYNNEDAWLEAMAQRNPLLRQVSVNFSGRILSDTGLYALAAHCPGLEELVCSCSPSVDDAAVSALAEQCPKLVYLMLYSLGLTNVTDSSVLSLAQGCPSLEVLRISCTELVTEEALLRLIDSCPRLRRLTVSAASMSKETALRVQQRAGGRKLLVEFDIY